MTDISIDLVSVLGIRSDGWVSVKAAPARESSAGGWVSGARDKVPMVAGVATLTGVEPGPAVLTITTDENNAVSSRWSESWLVTVPDSETAVPFRDLVDGQTDWPATVVKAAQVARAAAEAAAATAVSEADRARQAADEAEEGGVRPGGWLISDLAQEVVDQFGGGVNLPILGSQMQMKSVGVHGTRTVDGDQLYGMVLSLDDEMAGKADLESGVVPVDQLPAVPPAKLSTAGATAGMVATVGAGGVAAWAAAGGGATGIAVSGGSGGLTSPATTTNQQVLIGHGAAADGVNAVAVGASSKTTGIATVAIGAFAEAANQSVAIGTGSKALHDTAVAIGRDAATTKPNQIILGTSNRTVTMPGKAELGTGSVQVTLSTRLDAGKVQFGITWPGSSTFVPLATQP